MSFAIAYKNFAAFRNISHIGLGVAAINTCKVLRANSIKSDVWPTLSVTDLRQKMAATPVSHLIISAPWLPTGDLQKLSSDFPDVTFAVNCHSNVGFLQADRSGVKLIRDVLEVELGTANVHLAGNNKRFCSWVKSAFGAPCAYLPNLYFMNDYAAHQTVYTSGTLRIGIFGAIRPLKNTISAVAAALEIARHLRAPLEVWLSSGRTEGGGETVLGAIQEMLCGLPGVTLHLNGWQSWPAFRKTVAHMHLLLQPSYTESFNLVTADGIAEGVPSVVSRAIDWAPHDWKADVDDVMDIARVGRRLMHDVRAVDEGRAALQGYVAEGVAAYRKFADL